MKRNKINWRVPKGMEITDLDRKVLYYQDRGHLVPTRELIKTPEQIEGIRRSGIINTGVLDLVEKEIHAGMSTLEIDKLVYDYTISHGGIPATLGYEGFPKSCCTSINEVVCHGIPNEFDILEEGDIINVDCTTILDGYYADASRMFIIGKTTPKKEKLVQVTRECLEIGMEAAKPFGFIGDIGHAIEKHAKKNGFSVVRDLCGHGVGVEFHEEPDVEHFGKKGTGMLLVPGMVFTIEPMINAGTWEVFIDEEDGWTVVTEDELPSAQWECYLITDGTDYLEVGYGKGRGDHDSTENLVVYVPVQMFHQLPVGESGVCLQDHKGDLCGRTESVPASQAPGRQACGFCHTFKRKDRMKLAKLTLIKTLAVFFQNIKFCKTQSRVNF